LTRRSQDNQDKTMAQNRTQALLQPGQLDPCIVDTLLSDLTLLEGKMELALVEVNEPLNIETDIVD
jgi:hypothetical protein